MSLNKEKFGINFYKVTILLAIVLIVSVYFIKNDDKDYLSILRYMVMYFCFATIIPTGLVVREFLVCKYNLKKMIIKIILIVSGLAIGVIGFFTFIKTPNIALTVLFISLGILLFCIIPTIESEGEKLK